MLCLVCGLCFVVIDLRSASVLRCVMLVGCRLLCVGRRCSVVVCCRLFRACCLLYVDWCSLLSVFWVGVCCLLLVVYCVL